MPEDRQHRGLITLLRCQRERHSRLHHDERATARASGSTAQGHRAGRAPRWRTSTCARPIPVLKTRQVLRRQPAEDRPRPRDRARSRGAASSASRRAAWTSAPSSSSTAHHRAARRGQGGAAGLGRARRDPLALRPHPGDVRRRDHGRARPPRPTSASSAC